MPRKPEPVDTAIGLRVAAYRQERGFTQLALAKHVGISAQQLQKYEAGQNRIAASRLIELATAMDMNPANLLGTPNAGLPTAGLRGAGALLKAYSSIPSASHRRAVVALARALSAGCQDDG